MSNFELSNKFYEEIAEKFHGIKIMDRKIL